MKVLIDHQLPFLFAHGGLQIQIEQTKTALQKIGVEAEYLRFWDTEQSGDVLHFFGRCSKPYVELAQQKGLAVVMSDLLSETGSRSRLQLLIQRCLIGASRQLLPSRFLSRLGWGSFKAADAVIALTPWEADLMVMLFDSDRSNLHIVPNGVEGCFFSDTPSQSREDWLVSTVTIAPRKRAVELALAAAAGRVKLKIVGKPYSEQDPYFERFLSVCQLHSQFVEYLGPITDRLELASLYSKARGFVLLSAFESLSLSALEAAAAGCPLFLSDLPWARRVFGEHAVYCPLKATALEAGERLSRFAQNHSTQPKALAPLRWEAVAEQLRSIYVAAVARRGSRLLSNR